MNIPNSLPQLAVGSHDRGSGQACIMNAISYLNGDTKITDMPSCAHPLLAKRAIALNDSICSHRVGELLCPDCSHEMWMIGARIIGTADAVEGWSSQQKARLMIQLALSQAVRVQHLGPPKAAECNAITQSWLDGKATIEQVREARTAATATADAVAYATSYAANAAAYTAYATYAADAAADAAYATYAADAAYATYAADAAYAAYAADAAYAAYAADAAAYAAAASRVFSLHHLIDKFEELTGWSSTRVWVEEDAEAVKVGARVA